MNYIGFFNLRNQFKIQNSKYKIVFSPKDINFISF